jgi:hypothetical protein
MEEFDAVDRERWLSTLVGIVGIVVFPVVMLRLFVPAHEDLYPFGVIGFALLWLWIWYVGVTKFEKWKKSRNDR